ncbi:MAG TPA: ATP-binding cassette domain-containing protein [Ktedonobacteraceae bacterium]|nr:ATP-binding cassette domain-containing protein [Ktedonobacteraceae bacterium]
MLEVRGLEKFVDGHSVLAIETLDVGAGEIVAVIGPQGSGKTLLVRLLAGTLTLSGGSITCAGQHISPTQYDVRKQIGALFEEDLLYERQSARSNLRFSCQLYGLPASRIDEVLTQIGLSDQAQKAVTKLAPSAQRRLAFARLLMRQHCLLLLDQPILRADLDTQDLFARLLKQAAAKGAAIILTDEDLAWASKCCTRVVELEGGRIVHTYAFERESEGVAATPERFTPFKVPARKEDRILLYDPGDILYATSRDGKTYLRTASEEALTNFTLQELEARLLGRGFFKAHRAYLVNLQHIRSVVQYTRNSYMLQLSDTQETLIPLSKQSEKELQALLGY